MKYIEILDTTLRDGEQMRMVSFDKNEKITLAKILIDGLRVDRIEVASARSSKGEFEAVKEICHWAKKNSCLKKIEVLGFVDNLSVDWVSKAGGRVINLLTKGSLKHLKKQLKKTPQEHIKDISKVFKTAKRKGMELNVYLEDWSNGIKESPNYVFYLTEKVIPLNPKRIMLADTLGILSPEETYSYLKLMTQKFPDIHFDFHAHNDYGLATANSFMAIKAGAKGIHVTVNGIGERAGNAHLAEVCALINDKTPFKCRINEKFITRTSKLVERITGIRIPPNKPIIGENVFVQTAGIHADGDRKANLYISKLSSERFGKEREYALGKLSGKASLEENLKKLNIQLTEEEKKAVLERIVELGDKKEIVTSSDLPFIISDILKTPFKKPIEIVDVLVSSGLKSTPMVVLKIRVKNKIFQETATGDGGYDAFMNALRKIFHKKLKLSLPKLEDYEVRIPPGGRTDALVETKIVWRKDNESFITIGVDSDQVMAAIKSTEKMLNFVFGGYKFYEK
jgi:D-citramalate synthase